MNLRRVIEFPVVRIVIGIVAVVVLLVPAQVVAAGATTTSIRGVAVELYSGIAATAALWLVAHFIEKGSLADVGLPLDRRLSYLIAGLVLGVVVAGLAVGILAILGAYAVVGKGDLASSPQNTVLLLAFELGSAALQAVLFFGIIFRVLVEWLGRWPAITLTVVLFGAIHLSAPNATIVSAIIVGLSGGVLLSASYLATNNLWLPAGILWGVNFTFVEVFGAIPSAAHRILQARITGNNLLTGGSAGVEGGIATLVAAWLAVLLIIWWASTRTRVSPASTPAMPLPNLR